MFKIKNLTKIFEGKSKDESVIALNDVSLTFPDTGFIFITGKSGSGKSTLLNILGGLSGATFGEVVVDGNVITKFKTKDYNNYRSSYIGFVFQDYHLINELTVEENIKCFSTKNSEKQFEEILQILDIEGLENRYPSQLSGGQKQRVSIARALMKDSRVILCDEPTGNLDKETSNQILEKLKEISKERLVLIISHNQNDAEVFGDRIIELSEGKVILDISKHDKNSQKTEIIDGEVKINYGLDVTKKDINAINTAISNKEIIKFSQKENGFVETKEPECKENYTKLNKRKLAKKPFRSLLKSFYLNNKTSSIATIVLSIALILAFSVIQALSLYDPSEYVKTCLNGIGDPGVMLRNDANTQNAYSYPITDTQINLIKSAGYKGEIVKVLRYALHGDSKYTTSCDYSVNINQSLARYKNNMYYGATEGTILCSKEYLTKLYGQKGELNVLYGDINTAYDTDKLIITDYVADNLLLNNKRYNERSELITDKYMQSTFDNKMGAIGAIIDTNYEEKYSNLLEINEKLLLKDENYDIYKEKLLNEPNFEDFADECMLSLNYGYTFNENFADDATLPETGRVLASLSNSYLENDNISAQILTNIGYVSLYTIGKIGEQEKGVLKMHFSLYNYIFSTQYNNNNYNTYVPQKYTLKYYAGNSTSREVVYEKEFTVTLHNNANSRYLSMHEDDARELTRATLWTKNVILPDLSNIGNVTAEIYGSELEFFRTDVSAAAFLNDFIRSFTGFFVFIEILLIALILFYFITFSVKGIMKYRYQIGILKAMGVNSVTLSKIFVSKMAVIATAISAISFGGIILFTNKIDSLLVKTMEEVLRRQYDYLHVVTLHPSILLADVALVLLIIVLSALIPILTMRSIKPVDILRERE